MPEYTVESTRAYLPTSVADVTLVDSPEPVPAASTGVVRGRALYDTPSPGAQPETLRRSDRTRTATKRAQAGYLQSRAKSRERSEKIRRARAFSQSQASQNAAPTDCESTVEPANPEAGQEVHDRTASKSPTPIPTSTEQEAQPRLDRKQVQRDLTRRFWSTLADQSTQTLVQVLDDISDHPAHTIRPEAPDPEVFMLSPVPVGKGGGFHLDHPAHGSGKAQPYSGTSKIRNPQFKPPPPDQQLDCDDNIDTNTETESESDIEADMRPIRVPRLAPRLPSNPIADPDSPFLDPNGPLLRYPSTRSSLPVDQAPQNASTDADHITTAANPDVLPSPAPSVPKSSQLRTERSLTHISTSSKSLGEPVPPNLPDHSGVRAERSLTHISSSSRSLEDRIPTPALGQGLSRYSPSQSQASQHSNNTASQQQGSEPATHASLPAPKFPSAVVQKGTPAPSRAHGVFLDMGLINAQRTPSQTSGAGPSRRSREPTRNSAPWPASSTHTTRSRSRSLVSTQWPPAAPTPRRQVQHSQSRVPQLRSSQPPVPSPARSNTPPDLLPGDDGDDDGLSDYEGAARAIRTAAQGRKPSMLDLEGNEHFIVLKVKDVLWAFAIHEGSFQIRSVYCIWFEGIFQQVWIKELPGVTYCKPSNDACTVAVNSIPSRRGHVKERLRSIIKAFFKFVHPKDDTERAHNVETYNSVMPNRFHLLKPKENIGYYESEVIDESIAGAFFYSPTAIGVQFPNYFEKMENSIVAFVLSMIQFCISEWEGGSFKKKKLDANHLLALYICHYEGLKVADSVEDGPMPELRERWYKGSLAASQASSLTKNFVQPITRAEDIRRGQTRRQPHGVS